MKLNCFTHEPTTAENLEIIRSSIPSFLSGKRLEHTFSVEREALKLAEILFPYSGIDKKYLSDISAAALLHDITKYLPEEEHTRILKENNVDIDCIKDKSTAILHAKTAPFVAKEKFGINDIVFSAIFNHTTGKENMNIFDKIIFIADFIEETRTHKSCILAREYFYNNISTCKDKTEILDKTIIMSLDSTLSYLNETGAVIDTDTIKARNFLLAEYALPSKRTGDKNE